MPRCTLAAGLALLVLLLGACSDSPTGPSFPVEGEWVAYSVNGLDLPYLVAPNPDPDCEGIFLVGMTVVFTETSVEMHEEREDWCSPQHVKVPTSREGVWQIQGNTILVWSPPHQSIEEAGKFMVRGDELEWSFTYEVDDIPILSVIRLRRVPEPGPGAAAARTG